MREELEFGSSDDESKDPEPQAPTTEPSESAEAAEPGAAQPAPEPAPPPEPPAAPEEGEARPLGTPAPRFNPRPPPSSVPSGFVRPSDVGTPRPPTAPTPPTPAAAPPAPQTPRPTPPPAPQTPRPTPPPAPARPAPERPRPERVAPGPPPSPAHRTPPPPRPTFEPRPGPLAGTQPAPAPAPAPVRSRGSRRARQVIRRFDLWSVLRFSVIFYLCMFLILLVAGIVLWVVATITGVRGNIENFISDLIASKFHFLGLQLLRGAAIGGLLLVIIGSGVNMLMALLYNLISDVVGGIEITVLEDDKPHSPVV